MDIISCILPDKLYMSGAYILERNKHQLNNLDITLIINVAEETRDVIGEWKNIKIPLRDTQNENIVKYFDLLYIIIDNEINKGGKVLVHCYAGISRSSTIVISYLMKKFGCYRSVVHEFVKSHRDKIEPNYGFVKQLDQYQQILFANKNKQNN